jgi:eukaryotic-like serine/threonine-protein kinase
MALDDPLTLQRDVEIASVRRLSPGVRSALDSTDDDFVILRPRSRGGSHVVDAKTAALVQLFRSPTRIVDAIVAFSRVEGSNAEDALEGIYPFLFRLWSERLLVAPDDADAAPIESHFQAGVAIDGYRILRCIQTLEDTEVLLGRGAEGRYVAMKAARLPSEHVDLRLEHEASILRRLGGKRAPAVIRVVRADERTILITEWINGVDVATRALRADTGGEYGENTLLGLCQDVATAVADVHGAGVLHGDIHPQNFIVEPSGTVRMIDFGLARDLNEARPSVPRGGVPFYFEPEYAAAQLRERATPITPAGEQYALAALIYRLWTGTHYVDWRLERSEMLRQIIEAEPLAFEKRGVAPWPELEAVVNRALSKSPSDRYASVSDFALSLQELAPPPAATRERASTVSGRRRTDTGDLADEMIARYSRSADGLTIPNGHTPRASLTYGAAGIAYALYRIAVTRADARLIALADQWSQHAYALAQDASGFYSAELGITRDEVGDTSLFHSVAGVHFVRALVSGSVGDLEASDRALAALIDHSRRPCSNPDLTLGQASLVLGLSEVVESLPPSESTGMDLARERGAELTRHLEQILQTESMSTSTLLSALGVAHGWAGLLYVLLRWAQATKAPPAPIVAERLDELLEWAEPHAGGLRWPVYNGGPVAFVDGWCNGTAGHSMLFALAYRVFGREAYAQAAIQAAESSQTTETDLGTLCCGLAGVAYALLSAHRITGDQRWRTRAEKAASSAAKCTSESFYRDSLYKGAVGLAVLTEDLRDPESAAMPVFESIGGLHAASDR